MQSKRLKPWTSGDGANGAMEHSGLQSSDGGPTSPKATSPSSQVETTEASSSRHTRHEPSRAAPSSHFHSKRQPSYSLESDSARRKQAAATTAAPTVNGKRRALSSQDIGNPMPQTSLRELKKEAYKKYHRNPSTGFGGGRGRSGGSQPNLGARMGVMLEKMRRDTGFTA